VNAAAMRRRGAAPALGRVPERAAGVCSPAFRLSYRLWTHMFWRARGTSQLAPSSPALQSAYQPSHVASDGACTAAAVLLVFLTHCSFSLAAVSRGRKLLQPRG
jgi:hypothetical protein